MVSAEKDERFRYLLKYGLIKRCMGDFDSIFAELPQIPGVWIFYRRGFIRDQSPGTLDFGNHNLSHIPLMEGKPAASNRRRGEGDQD